MILDLGCSDKKHPGAVGMDKRAVAGVDLVHDMEIFPWPIDDCAFDSLRASHVLEHIKPWLFFDVMNEAWRVLNLGGEFEINTPYGPAFAFDPTHTIPIQESSFMYLDKRFDLIGIYNPKPWHIMRSRRNEELFELHTTLRKVA